MDIRDDVRIGLTSNGRMMVRAHLTVHGDIHGKGFLKATREKALELGLRGWVGDAGNGTVQAVIEGEDGQANDLVNWCKQGPPGAVVSAVDVMWTWPEHSFQTFSISRSIRQAARLETDMPAVITTGNGIGENHVKSRLRNISATGVNILTMNRYSEGDEVTVSFKAPSGRTYKRLPCKAIRIKRLTQSGDPVELGALFADPPDDLVKEINNSVNLLW